MKTVIRHVISVTCILLLFLASYRFFNYILTDDTVSYTRIAMHQFYEQDNIDILFLGSSHCYRSLDPRITDEIFHANTFNGGTSAQETDGSLAIAREAIKHNDVKEIYLEMLYSVAEAGPRKDRTQLTSTYIISDYMHPGLNKLFYLLNASSKEYYLNSFLTPIRNRNRLNDPQGIRDLIQVKRTYEYKNYIWDKGKDPTEYYTDKGFVANNGSLEGKEIWVNPYTPKAFDHFSEEWENDVRTLAGLCRKNNIKLTLFVSPIPEWSILCMENYDRYKDAVSALAEECSVEYYDFNYCDSSFFDSSDPRYYKDNGHLNTAGADAFSHLFADFMTGKLNKKEILHETIQDKIKNEEPRLLGLSRYTSEDDETDDRSKEPVKIKIVSNKKDMEYRISVSSGSGKPELIRDFDSDRFFTAPPCDKGTLIIEWRMQDSPSAIHTERFTYSTTKPD